MFTFSNVFASDISTYSNDDLFCHECDAVVNKLLTRFTRYASVKHISSYPNALSEMKFFSFSI